MDDHLTKPLDPEQLEEVLERYLGDAPALPKIDQTLAPSAIPQDPVAIADQPGTAASPPGSLKQRYAVRRNATINMIDAIIDIGQFTDVEIGELAAMAHTLAGTAGMFGEAALGDAAATLDDGLETWPVEERAARLRRDAPHRGNARSRMNEREVASAPACGPQWSHNS